MNRMNLYKIFHISDIHIRNGDDNSCRFKEYSLVFDRLFDSIKFNIGELKLNEGEYIIVVSGDIFHNKNVIGNYGLFLYKKLIEGLTNLGKTIIFHGNHDKNQNEIEQPTLLSSTFNIPNLTILKDSTSFVINDIGFSYVSIDDTLDVYKTSGRIETLPAFPTIQGPVRHKVALFHGTFANVKLNNNVEIKDYMNPYPFEWIKEYDFAILGDIHLRQKGWYNKTLWGYAGSLIQQNHGEDIIHHGYMIWDLDTKEITNIDVYNDQGYTNIKQDDNNIITIKYKNNYEPLEKIIVGNKDLFPKHIDVKLFSKIDFQSMQRLLNKHNIGFNIISNKVQHNTNDNIIQDDYNEHINDLNIDNDSLLQYFNKHLSKDKHLLLIDILKDNEKLLIDPTEYPDELKIDCIKRNKELTTMINSCLKCQDIIGKYPKFTIKYLEWENLYCYESKNWIDFSKCESETFLISGANGVGKSAIYDILTLAIWGDVTPSKQSPISNGIIHYKHQTAYTIIDIFVCGETYRIIRKYVKKDTNNVNKKHITLYKIKDYHNDNSCELISRDNACNEKIKDLFGDMNDFLLSSMITQNVDFDILKMNYKDTISLIDKTSNIDYIYHLYDLFKNSMKKYKDLHKIVKSKKEVYERLMVSSESNQDSETEILQYKDDLELLLKEKEELTNENNSIAIDVNNKDSQMILQIDYDNLIANLGTIEIQNELDYQQTLELYNEYKVLFKNTNDNELLKLKQSYNNSMKFLEERIKPCEYDIIEGEERALHHYKDIKLEEKYSLLSIKELKDTIDELRIRHTEVSKEYERLNNEKPVSYNKPEESYNSIIQNVNKLFKSKDNAIKDMKSYCSHNPYIHNKINKTYSNTTVVTFDDYNDCIRKKNQIEKRILLSKSKITDIENEFKVLYSKLNKVIVKPLPSVEINQNTSYEIKNKLDECDIEYITEYVNKNEPILENFYKSLDYIHKLEEELLSYETELNLLNTNDEYKYNPNCEYCCKRSWVCRMKELNIIIEKMKNDINEEKVRLYDVEIDYIDVYEKVCNNKNKIVNHDLIISWYEYYLYKEEYDKLNYEINSLMNDKQSIIELLQNDEKDINNCLLTISIFNNNAHSLYNDYVAYNNYKVFYYWKKEYENVNKEKKEIENVIKTLSDYITLKPRYDKLEDLKNHYNEWLNYHQHNMIIKASKYCELKRKIDQYDKYNEYKRCKDLKPLIKHKTKLIEQINEMDKKIKNINDMISKLETIKEYNNTYNSNIQKLLMISNDIELKIELMDIVIDKFKDYRKDLYENIILRKIVDKTNKYIKTLCHNDTKKFEIDYIINEVKDIIHVNWLIRNVVDNDTKQVISINQASGYQRFVISLSLRMSLYSNKQCSQLFFDEGFTACDKNNLSIVPSFLKGLLKLFDSVIIASHIELIQDSVDNKVEISYNPVSKSSSITYGDYFNTNLK